MYPFQQNPVTLFARELASAEPAIDRLALYIAQIEYPDIDVSEYVALVDELAVSMVDELRLTAPGYERAQRFLAVFNDTLHFRGNTENYYETDNSFLNRVLTRRVGLPILLSLVCVAIGNRIRHTELDVDLRGVGLPSHFMVRYAERGGIWLLDPFYGKVLPPEEVATYLSSLFEEHLNGRTLELPANILRPVSLEMLLFRVLNNLRIVYLESAQFKLALRVMDYMLELVSDDPQLWKERGLLNHHCNNLEQASRDLRRYFFLNGQWEVAIGMHDEMELDVPTAFLTNQKLLEQLDEGDLDDSVFDDAVFDESLLDCDEADEFDISTWNAGSVAELSEFDDELGDSGLDGSDSDLDDYDYVELTDEEYHLAKVLADIESLRISLN